MTSRKRRAPQRNPRFVDPRKRPCKCDGARVVLKLVAHGDQLARLSIAGAEMPVVKQQYSKVRESEALRVRWQARIARASETMGHHNAGSAGAVICPHRRRHVQPGAASNAAAPETDV